jgi:hypothetical protein
MTRCGWCDGRGCLSCEGSGWTAERPSADRLTCPACAGRGCADCDDTGETEDPDPLWDDESR